jgi:hypothetical protein
VDFTTDGSLQLLNRVQTIGKDFLLQVYAYCNMHACLRPLLSNSPSQQVNSGDAC